MRRLCVAKARDQTVGILRANLLIHIDGDMPAPDGTFQQKLAVQLRLLGLHLEVRHEKRIDLLLRRVALRVRGSQCG
jgi:hypothetical protein